MVKVLIDNGHGQGSPKGSPDGKHKEWKWARAMAKRLAIRLNHYGIPSHILVPEDADISLKDRAARANAIAAKEKCILVSIHCNASGADGKWHDAHGWSIFVSLNASGNSKALASMMSAKSTLYIFIFPLSTARPVLSRPHPMLITAALGFSLR